MQNTEKTLEKFGYSIEKLGNGSHKPIVVECEYCGKDYFPDYKNHLTARKKYEDIQFFKDSCKQCNNLKGNEIAKLKGIYDDRIKKSHEKKKQTNLEKYGVEYAQQSQIVKDKVSEAWQNKTEEEIQAILEKRQDTLEEKTGFRFTLQNPESREKYKETCQEKYGVSNPSESEILKLKREDTMIGLYGFKNAGQSPQIIEKIKATNEEKYGGLYMNIPEKKREFQDRSWQTRFNNGDIIVINGKTIPQIAKERDISNSLGYNLYKNGVDIETYDKKYTAIEDIMRDFLIQNNIDFIFEKKIDGRAYDFLIGGNIIIECNGNYWHSEANDQIDQKYHQIKRKHYMDRNYKPLFFREDEILHKMPIIKSIILNKLGKSERIFARKCKLVMMKEGNGEEWFEKNHLMGKGRGTAFFLLQGEELVAGLQIKCLNKEKKIFEISRFCTKLNTSVIGGFTKLLKAVENYLDMNELVTFIDLRYGEGNYLKDFGFEYMGANLSFKWIRGLEVHNRMKFPGDSGREREKPYYKLWDCGQAKYIKTFNSQN